MPGDRRLDEFEAGLGLPPHCPPAVEVEATRLLQMEPAQLRLLTAAECGENAFALEQFAFFLQRAANREQARLHRAEAVLRRLLPPLLRGRREYMLEEKKMMAVSESAECREWECRRAEAQLRLDSLLYLANRVSALANLFVNIQQTRGQKL